MVIKTKSGSHDKVNNLSEFHFKKFQEKFE